MCALYHTQNANFKYNVEIALWFAPYGMMRLFSVARSIALLKSKLMESAILAATYKGMGGVMPSVRFRASS